MRRMWISAMLVGGVALSAVSGGWAQDATGEAAKPQMMAKDADPNIEVASVRASDPNDTKEHFGMIGRHLVIEREPVEVLLRVGFGVQKSQIANVPEWARTELFNVDAVPDMPGDPDLEQTKSLIRKLLVQRFGLQVHHEQRAMEVYALTVSKGGLRIKKSVQQDGTGQTDLTASNSQRRALSGRHTTMAEFLGVMQSAVLDRPVVDRTGLEGRWDFDLQWRPNDMADTGDANALPGLFTAIQEQMGLKLEPTKAPADVLVIDKVERPAAN